MGNASRPGRATVIVEGATIELSERDMHTIVDGQVGDDFVVAAAQVLHERAPAGTMRSAWVVFPRVGLSRALSRP
jgi:hypothetical protein